eukprot:3248984-Rhodomonas_salina.2
MDLLESSEEKGQSREELEVAEVGIGLTISKLGGSLSSSLRGPSLLRLGSETRFSWGFVHAYVGLTYQVERV